MDDGDSASRDSLTANEVEEMASESIASLLATTDDFETILRMLVLAADAKGIDVRGGWPVFADEGESGSWDVEIVEIVRDH